MSKHDPTAAARHRRLIQKRYAQRIEGPDGRLYHPRAPHGTPNGYRHYGCRDIPCTEAAAADRAHKKQQRQARLKLQQAHNELNP